MKEELDRKLCEDFPYIFRDRNAPMSKTCMCFGFPSDGWYKPIREICEMMEKIRQRTGIVYVADQVKEKFGGLRFYFHDDRRLLQISPFRRKQWHGFMSRFVTKQELLCESICEGCGNPAKPSNGPWIKVLCEECLKDSYK